MRFSLYRKYGARNSPTIFDAVESGLRQHGHTVVTHDDAADVAVIWSQLWAGTMRHNQAVFGAYRASGRPVVVIEVGAVHRNLTWRVLLNGVHQFLVTGQDDARARDLGMSLRNWRVHGQHILIAMQRADSQQWQGMPSTDQWLAQTVKRLRQHTDRPIKVRPHPRSVPRLMNTQVPEGCTVQMPNHVVNTYDNFDFEQGLQDAWAVVNYNSNPGVVSVMQGVPAFVGDSSLARSVANLDFAMIEQPLMPDRRQWLNDLAWHEWRDWELQSGTALECVLDKINDRA